MSQHSWLYMRDGILGTAEEVGPLPEAELVALAKAGKVKRDTLVRCDSRNPGKWFALKQIPGLLKQLEAGQHERALIKAESDRKRAEEEKAAKAEIAARHAEYMNRVAAFSEQQDPDLISSIAERVQGILTSSETVQLIVVQEKPMLNVSPDAVVVTNRRMIFYHPKLLGRFEFNDYLLIDLSNAHVKQGMMGSTFTAQHVSGRWLVMEWLPKAGAQRLYRLAQELEERARQARIEMDLEYRRAGATNINIGQIPAPQQIINAQPVISAAPSGDDLVQRLEKLKTMLDRGLITPGDFDRRKDEILREV